MKFPKGQLAKLARLEEIKFELIWHPGGGEVGDPKHFWEMSTEIGDLRAGRGFWVPGSMGKALSSKNRSHMSALTNPPKPEGQRNAAYSTLCHDSILSIGLSAPTAEGPD